MKQTLWMTFLKDERGAVTVDWVVLTAAIVGIGMMVLIPIAYATDNATNEVSDFVASQPVGYKGN